jgi:phosphoserine aminotransferase
MLYNFGAGPAMLPLSVLNIIKQELNNWQSTGMSIMEIGHRTAIIQELMQELETNLRELLAIPNNYYVLFLSGAARTQFAMIPLNLLWKDYHQAGYIITGIWSELAYQEACKLKKAYCLKDNVINKHTKYIYYTHNETINGVRLQNLIINKNIALIADCTSSLLTEPIDVNNFGLMFAGAQKNLG